MIRFRARLRGKKQIDWFLTFPDRVHAFARMYPQEAVRILHERLVALDDGELGNYSRSLERGVGTYKGEYVATLRLPKNLARIKIDGVAGQNVVLYVEPRFVSGRPVSRGAMILAEYNPWTYNTLPFMPQKRDARVVVRSVSLREVKYIDELRRSDIVEVRERLRNSGVQFLPRKDTPLQDNGNVYRDIGFEVIRREYGIMMDANPHWRVAARGMLSDALRETVRKSAPWLVRNGNRYRQVLRSRLRRVPSRHLREVARFAELIVGGTDVAS